MRQLYFHYHVFKLVATDVLVVLKLSAALLTGLLRHLVVHLALRTVPHRDRFMWFLWRTFGFRLFLLRIKLGKFDLDQKFVELFIVDELEGVK